MNNKTKEKTQKWIPIKTGKLPKNNTKCWITVVVDGKKALVTPTTFRDGSWLVAHGFGAIGIDSKLVVAWMRYQKPKPYKKESEDEE